MDKPGIERIWQVVRRLSVAERRLPGELLQIRAHLPEGRRSGTIHGKPLFSRFLQRAGLIPWQYSTVPKIREET